MTAIMFLAGCVGAVSPVQAQEDPETDLEMELFFAPAETVSSAVRHDQPLELSPSAVTVLTREDIEASGARTLPEVLRLVPNMDIHLVKPFWYMVGIRGEPSLSSDTVLLLVDGRDITLEFFGFPAWAVGHFSLDDVERIEIIRGPGSALYGANAYSGVVHVITTPPGEGRRAQASVHGGEDGAIELSCRSTDTWGPVSLGVSAGMAREDLWSLRDQTGRKVVRGKLNGSIELGPNSSLLLDAGVFQVAGNQYTDLGTPDINRITNPYGKLRFDFHELMVTAAYDHVDMDVDMNMAFNYGDLLLARLPAFDGYVGKLTIQAQHGIELFHNRLTYGAEYIHNRYYAAFLIPNHLYEHRAGIYLQDELDLSGMLNELFDAELRPLLLTVGLRADAGSITESSSTRWEFSPRAAFVYSPAEGHGLRLGYAHAFLKPTFFETSLHTRLVDSQVGMDELDLGTPDLENQSIDALEIGYSGSFFDGRLNLRLDLAYNWYRGNINFQLDTEQMNYISMGGFVIPDITGPGIGFYNDEDEQQGPNIEAQAVLRPAKRIRLFALAGFRKVYEMPGGQVRDDTPTWQLALGADWGSDFGLKASVRAFFYSSFSRAIGNPEGVLEPSLRLQVPAYWYLNARIAWTLVRRPFELTMGCAAFNLLGFRFREFPGISNPVGQDHAGELLGRRVVLFLDWRY